MGEPVPRILVMIFLIILPFAVFSDTTELKLYRPFGESGSQSALTAEIKRAGECWKPSEKIIRDDAWRCIAEGKIYDPCFVKKSQTGIEVRCPVSPWSDEVVEITLTGALPEQTLPALDMSVNFPWAIELGTGERCLAMEPGSVYETMDVHYQCNSEMIVMGHLQRCKKPWTMIGKKEAQLQTVVIVRAWF